MFVIFEVPFRNISIHLLGNYLKFHDMTIFTKPIPFLFLFFFTSSIFAQNSISGFIRCANNQLFPNVQVSLIGDGVNEITYTDASGFYSFNNLENGNYVVTPTYDDNSLNGITTLDALLAHQALLNINPPTPFQFLAMDVNFSNTISVEDINMLRDMAIQNIPYCQNSTCWRFATPDYQNLPAAGALGAIVLQLSADAADLNFIGVKVGDFNFNGCP
jgi:Carboxypeptidase regulatory-like domain